MKRGKKAQFYIIAAIVIIAIIAGLTAISNQISTKEKPKKFYDLFNNLELEGTNAVKYGIYQMETIDPIIQNLTEIFSSYMDEIDEQAGLVIISGSPQNVTVRSINRTYSGEVTVQMGPIQQKIYEGQMNQIEVSSYALGSENLTLVLNENLTQNIQLSQGQNFIFILTREEGFERYIETNIYS